MTDPSKNKASKYIERYRALYGDKYQYPDFIGHSTDIIDIQCPVHGVFQREAYRHLYQGCHKCAPRGDSFKTFTDRARELFGDKFTYDQSTFKTNQEKMRIVCPNHGEFWQELYSHIRLAHGCPKCGFEVSAEHSRDDLQSFLDKAKKTHGERYDYSKAVYVDSTTPLDIYCKIHGTYFKQQPVSHIRGRGCHTCMSSKGELAVEAFLKRYGIEFKRELVIPPNRYKYDFYLPDYNIFIEFHGMQHYRFKAFFHKSVEHFKSNQLADAIKADIIKALKGKLIVTNYRHLECETLDKYLMECLLKCRVPVEVFKAT